jgi:hypothetical protein
VLHCCRIELRTDAIEHRLATDSIVAEHPDLDQLVRAQVDVDLMQHAWSDAVLADGDDRLQVMRFRAQRTAQRRGEHNHARFFARSGSASFAFD